MRDAPLNRTGVVITNADFATALGTARALRGADLELIGVCTDPGSRFCRSRVWDRLVKVDIGLESYLETFVALGEAARRRLVLFPTGDRMVQLISDNRDLLGRYYDFVLPDAPVLDLLLDKTKFCRWAEERGFTVPVTRTAASPEELEAALEVVPFPCLLKPIFRTQTWNLTSKQKVFLLGAKRDLAAIPFDLFQASPRYVLQQWIAGGDADVHFCLSYFDRQGVETGHYTGRKLLQWPVGTGSTAICVGTADEEVHRLSRDLLVAAGLRGLGSVEFKRSRQDGRYYVIEPTVGRHDLQSFVAVAGGVNLTLMAFHDAARSGVRVPIRERKATWIEEYNTRNALRYLRRHGAGDWRGILRGLGGRVTFSSFSLADPWPFLGYVAQRFSRGAARSGGGAGVQE